MRGGGITRLVVVGLAVLLGACNAPAASNAPDGSPSPTPSASTAAIASAVATAAPATTSMPTVPPTPTLVPNPPASDYPELGYVNRFVMRVAVSDLNVRQKPSTAAKSNGKAPKGGLFMMFDWPVRANGYTWYSGFTLLTSKPGVLPDLPTPIDTGYDEVLGGWMAIGTEDAPFLVPLAPRCPTVRDVQNVAAMLDSERIACFGSATLELEGRYAGEGCGGVAPGTFEPDWLAYPLECARLGPRDGTEDAPALYLHFAPEGPALPTDQAVIRIRGHFSDARSTTCRITVLGDDGELSVPIANAAAEQWCRGKFVVESYEVIG